MSTTTADSSPSQAICSQIESRLWQERERIYAEIHAYPPPIPACDAQFNYLIEKRAVVAQEIRQAQGIENGKGSQTEKATELRRFIVASQILNNRAKKELLEALN